MQKLIYIFAVVFVLSTGTSAFAIGTGSVTPIQLGIYPPVQFPNESFKVNGLRLSLLLGKNRVVRGIDLGLIGNQTVQDFTGIAIAGVFNWTEGTGNIYGGQLAGFANLNENRTNVFGVQASLLANIGRFTDIYGVQMGIYNRAHDVYGIQIGLVNYASNLHGIQIGLANFNENGYFTVSPLINIGF